MIKSLRLNSLSRVCIGSGLMRLSSSCELVSRSQHRCGPARVSKAWRWRLKKLWAVTWLACKHENAWWAARFARSPHLFLCSSKLSCMGGSPGTRIITSIRRPASPRCASTLAEFLSPCVMGHRHVHRTSLCLASLLLRQY